MAFTIALAGNPNSGKTTLFNEVTGSTQHVGNWPGVTVEKKEGFYKKNKEIKVVDLPGIYSLSPYSAEEIVARDFLIKEKPDVVVNIVDGTNIERNLYLTLQILETNVPMVIALNMMDEVESRGDVINIEKLSSAFGVAVIPIVARSRKGLSELMDSAIRTAENQNRPNKLKVFNDSIDDAIKEISSLLDVEDENERNWQAIKVIEGDDVIMDQLPEDKVAEVSKIIDQADKDADGDVEAQIADLRYQYIGKLVKDTVKRKNVGHVETRSDKIDKILTNRFFAIPIFVIIMYLMFSITFGEGIFGVGVWLQTIVVDFWEGPLTETIMGFLERAGAAEWTLSLVGDGIIAGVGGVVSFMPQILVLFLLMSFLEDSGYMARVAFVMDRIFRKFGLSGKSFIPLLMGFGCSVPAIMASRTLENEKDRKLTMMITPFMSCGAKLPIYLMFAATLFPNDNQTLIVFSIYFLGLGVAILSGIILSKTMFKGNESNFIMELPQYRIPTLKSVFIHAWEKVKGFVVKAGTVIFVSTVFIWLLSRFTFTLQYLPEKDMELSIIAQIGKTLKFIFIPLGFGNDWRPVVGTITGFIAKENIVSSFGVLFHAAEGVVDAAAEGSSALPGVADVFTKLSAYAYMAFNLLCMPCFAAVGALRREMGSWKWTLKAVGFQMVTAWIVAFLIYQIGSLFIG